MALIISKICIVTLLLHCYYILRCRASWTFQHKICSSDLQFTNPDEREMKTLKNAPESSIFDRKVVCRDTDYIQYVYQELPTATGFKKSVLDAISSLYTDLEESKQPKLLKVNDKAIKVFPMTFSIPEEYIVKMVPAKERPFSRVVPGDESTYFSIYEEAQYRQDLSRSLFSITYKKGGWDCLRHYEILAAGALPLFFEINKCPNQTISLHPKKLYNLILQYPGLSYTANRVEKHRMSIENLKMETQGLDKRLYMAVTSALLQYTRNVFSTKAMAAYVLNAIKKNQVALGSPADQKSGFPSNILYISHQDHDMDKGDYMTDFLLHGLLSLLGSSAVTEFPHRDGLYKTEREFNESSEYIPRRKRLYGMGFSWGLTIDDWELKSTQQRRSHDDIVKNIKEKAYDLVILGSGHRDGWAARLLLWDQVCASYPPAMVAWVEGSDNHLFSRDHPAKMLQKYSPCAEHLFSREGHSPTFSAS